MEGLGTPENPHLIQEAFVLSGAIQCGFCTPGMIMATKALLDQNPNPTVGRYQEGPGPQSLPLYRLQKIIDAVRLAGKFLRGENYPGQGPSRSAQEDDGSLPSPPHGDAESLRCGQILRGLLFRQCSGDRLRSLPRPSRQNQIGRLSRSRSKCRAWWASSPKKISRAPTGSAKLRRISRC